MSLMALLCVYARMSQPETDENRMIHVRGGIYRGIYRCDSGRQAYMVWPLNVTMRHATGIPKREISLQCQTVGGFYD